MDNNNDDDDTHPPRIIVRVGMVFRRGQKIQEKVTFFRTVAGKEFQVFLKKVLDLGELRHFLYCTLEDHFPKEAWRKNRDFLEKVFFRVLVLDELGHFLAIAPYF